MSEAVNDVKDRGLGPNLPNHFKISVEWIKNILCKDAINSYDYESSVIDEWVWDTGGMTTTGVKLRHSGETPSQVSLWLQKMTHGLSSERTPTSTVTGRRPSPLVERHKFCGRTRQLLLRPVSLWDHPNVKQVTCAGMLDPRHQVVRAAEFRTATPNICGSSLGTLVHASLLDPIILKRFLYLWKICATLTYDVY